jgi:nucleotide-binding universal stress UspA family protein
MSSPPNIEHIVVAHDFSETTDAALAYATTIAAKFAARITLMHAYQRPADGYPEGLVDDFDFSSRIESAAAKALEGVAARARSNAIPIAVVLRKGTPWIEIVTVAEQTKADLIVMGTHGRRGVSRALLGSVAEKVVRTASCPVLTVHASPTLENDVTTRGVVR